MYFLKCLKSFFFICDLACGLRTDSLYQEFATWLILILIIAICIFLIFLLLISSSSMAGPGSMSVP